MLKYLRGCPSQPRSSPAVPRPCWNESLDGRISWYEATHFLGFGRLLVFEEKKRLFLWCSQDDFKEMVISPTEQLEESHKGKSRRHDETFRWLPNDWKRWACCCGHMCENISCLKIGIIKSIDPSLEQFYLRLQGNPGTHNSLFCVRVCLCVCMCVCAGAAWIWKEILISKLQSWLLKRLYLSLKTGCIYSACLSQ